ncbi:carboxypeptidase-like regulatory domain-containing protein [Niabella hibiscisoli]|uniref:carboxypeptidase-like regulatory domain-containing protein n=1 Tax=Niabella hibiscisoli TaxID=1825928 RepID=UPI001F10E170|nr:carboxypeptidase-like regulatory domain-containing protein [Niabella hibiscisoli]MCH5720026.1 carboxypeptidase-like regulatory domain-containing protein [Niabella hibiscisoli]
MPVSVFAQSRTISGKVTDDKGQPLAGISVTIDSSGVGATTNAQGAYTISFNKTDASLGFTGVGYLPRYVSIGDRSVIDISLEPDIANLSEVVVVGYGTQKSKRNRIRITDRQRAARKKT